MSSWNYFLDVIDNMLINTEGLSSYNNIINFPSLLSTSYIISNDALTVFISFDSFVNNNQEQQQETTTILPLVNTIDLPQKILEHKNDCYICLDTLLPGSCVRQLPCGHFFCFDCIYSWLNEYHHTECPTCKNPIII